MSFVPLRRLDFPDLATASDGNQLIDNLEALRARANSATTGVFNVSFNIASQSAVQVSASHLIAPPNYPARTQLLVALAGVLTVNLNGPDHYYRTSMGFHVSATPGAGSGTPVREQWLLNAYGGTLLFRVPIFLQARVTYVPPNMYAFAQIYTASFNGSKGIGTGTVPNRFDGHLFVKEL